jgi:hypothetical protein
LSASGGFFFQNFSIEDELGENAGPQC